MSHWTNSLTKEGKLALADALKARREGNDRALNVAIGRLEVASRACPDCGGNGVTIHGDGSSSCGACMVARL